MTTAPELVMDPAQTYLRAAAAVESVDLDAGVIDAKLVPYDVEADLGGGLHEVFTRGAFAAAVGNPSRVKVTDQQHNRAVNIGKAIALRDEDDGLYGRLRIWDTTAGRDVLVLMREQVPGEGAVLEELSVEFSPLRGKFDLVRRGPGDMLVRHRKAALVGVSPVGAGAYGDQARVLLVRSAQRDTAREEALTFLASLTSGSSGVR